MTIKKWYRLLVYRSWLERFQNMISDPGRKVVNEFPKESLVKVFDKLDEQKIQVRVLADLPTEKGLDITEAYNRKFDKFGGYK